MTIGQDKLKMDLLYRKYSELFNDQDRLVRELNIIMSEFAEIALLENQIIQFNEMIKRRQLNIINLHKKIERVKREKGEQ